MAVFARRPKKVAVITRRPYKRGGHKTGFHCSAGPKGVCLRDIYLMIITTC